MTKLILDLSLGTKFRAYRKQRGYTQMDVVRKMNLYGSEISESTYSKIEQGVRNIFVTDLIILKLVLGFTYDDLFSSYEDTILQSLDQGL